MDGSSYKLTWLEQATYLHHGEFRKHCVLARIRFIQTWSVSTKHSGWTGIPVHL